MLISNQEFFHCDYEIKFVIFFFFFIFHDNHICLFFILIDFSTIGGIFSFQFHCFTIDTQYLVVHCKVLSTACQWQRQIGQKFEQTFWTDRLDPILHLYGWAMGCNLPILWRKVTKRYLSILYLASLLFICVYHDISKQAVSPDVGCSSSRHTSVGGSDTRFETRRPVLCGLQSQGIATTPQILLHVIIFLYCQS